MGDNLCLKQEVECTTAEGKEHNEMICCGDTEQADSLNCLTQQNHKTRVRGI